MASKFLLILLPALALATIDVEISGNVDADGNSSNMKVYYSGTEVGIISDDERSTFNLGDNSLKNAVNAYFGRRPDDAYLRSPTPWGDLYQSYGWEQVVRTLVPKNARVLQVSSQPQIIMRQIFENNSSRPAVFNVGISQSVQNTVSSSWSKSGELSIGQEIKYGFDIEVLSGGGSTSLTYTSSWGSNTEKSQTVTVGSSSEINMLLQPGQSVLAELQANRGSITVEVEYDASLSGASAVNYSKTYKGHHFWSLDIRAVMSYGNLVNNKPSKETINIGFYSSSKVIVHDRELGNLMLEVDF